MTSSDSSSAIMTTVPEPDTPDEPSWQESGASVASATAPTGAMLRVIAAVGAAVGVLTIAVGAATGHSAVAGLVAVAVDLAILLLYGGAAVRTSRALLRGQTAAELDAQASHNQLQKLIDNTAAVIYMKRIDNGRYLLVNREWERLFKVDRKRVINLDDSGVFPKELA